MGGVGVEAGPFFDLEFDELDEPHLFARTRDVAEVSVRVGEHDPGFGDVEELDATFCERLHEVDEVVGVDQGVRQRDERLDQELLRAPCLPLPGPLLDPHGQCTAAPAAA